MVSKKESAILLGMIDCNYNKNVMKRAWQDYKIKKAHKGYEKWTFSESLHYAHRTIKALRKNGL